MVIPQLETAILSGKTRFREIPELLLDAIEFRGSELYVSPLSDRKPADALDLGDA